MSSRPLPAAAPNSAGTPYPPKPALSTGPAAATSGSGAAADLARLDWSFDPWREDPRRALLATGCVLAAFLLTRYTGQAAVLAVLLALAVAGTLSPLLVAQRCVIDAAGVAVRGPFGWERRPWAELRRARVAPGSILVSPFLRPGRLDAFRALVLPVPRGRRDELVAAAAGVLERHGL